MEFRLKICLLISCGISVVTSFSFSWSNCGSPTDPVKFTYLDAYTNNSKMLYVTARLKVAFDLFPPIEGQILMQKKFFWTWLKIPCLKDVGSCTYDDVCHMSSFKDGEPCPLEFAKNDLPCKCPVLQGQYAAKNFPIDMSFLPHWMTKGSYQIKVLLSQDDEELTCLLVYLNF